MKTVNLSLAEAYTLARDVLLNNGFCDNHADAIARNVINGERDGCASHGLWRLTGIVDTLNKGKVSANASPVIIDQAPAIVKVDAGGAFSLVAYEQALPVLIEKAHQCGIAVMAINHCVHFSALFADIEPITDAGLIGYACTPGHAWVAPAGGTKPLFGTNPVAFGWPRKNQPPYIFDMATSMVARGEIQLHLREGLHVPEGWGFDKNGKPSTEPAKILEGAMTTFGGYKGSAFATMIELMAGPLIGDMTSQESSEWDNGTDSLPYGGELILAFSPKKILGENAQQHIERAEHLFTALRSQGTRLPGERRFAARKKSISEGLFISESLHKEIYALSACA
ncbi:Ldh family oxidoreductase [Salmonella enterica]|nr:Ldh family oxidoreductase [Salmonella enterica]EKJ5694743.1 Ldh family oxidoreductase [Salmonella enterica]